MQRAGHRIDATGECKGERSNPLGTSQLEFVLAKFAVVNQRIHASRVDDDIAFFRACVGVGPKANVSRRLLALQRLAILQDYDLGSRGVGEAMTKFTADASYFIRKVCGPGSTASKYSAVEAHRPVA